MKRAIVWGVALGAAIVAASALPVGDAVGRLNAARIERTSLVAVPSRQPAALPADLRVADIGTLANRLRGQAARDGVLVERLDAKRDGALARAQVRVSGSPEAVLHFADAIERGRPLVRFAAWRIEPAGDAVRLQGEAIAPWR